MAIGYQLKITVQGTKPAIWRRVVVPEHITFCDLDDIIEKIFGWTHSHLYEFIIADWGMRITGAPLMEEEDNAEECIDSWIKEGSVIYYTYDFGDNWEHLIKVEKLVEYEHRYPTVLKFKGPNMIEDCGGIWGFAECIDDAEAFDMKAVNAEFRIWQIPVAEPVDELIDFVESFESGVEYDGFADDIEEDWAEELYMSANPNEFDESYIRERFGTVERLEDVYSQYTKDDLVSIAKIHKLTGYSKYKKSRLIEWLVQNLLEEQHILGLIINSDTDEIALFEEAIEENGIFMPEEVLERSLFLSTYGGFLPYYNFYHVPFNVQNTYKKIMSGAIKEQVENAQSFSEFCESCMFLYGVISLSDLRDIYCKYEQTNISEETLLEKVQAAVKKDNLLTLKNGYLMDERLEEEDLYIDVLKEQEKTERYLPEDIEEFLEFGKNGIQEPDENTRFFLEYLMKEANLNNMQASLAFCLVLEAIRMNQDDEELLEILSELGCSLNRKKQFDKAEKMLKKISNRTRKWEYNGHTLMELNSKIVEFPMEKKK